MFFEALMSTLLFTDAFLGEVGLDSSEDSDEEGLVFHSGHDSDEYENPHDFGYRKVPAPFEPGEECFPIGARNPV